MGAYSIMIQGTKRRGAAALATVLAAMALAAGVAGRGCTDRQEGPESAVRKFIELAQSGNQDAIYAMLGPRTRAWLDRASERASHMVGGSRRYEPLDMLAVGAAAPPTRITVAKREGDRARVEVVDEQGRSRTLEATRIDGSWRVELVDLVNGTGTGSGSGEKP